MRFGNYDQRGGQHCARDDTGYRIEEAATGEKALETDRLMRRIGMVYGAENAQKFIEQDTFSHDLLHAYCEGINAYIKTLKPKDYPVEYKLLDYAPEEWQPIKVGLLLKNMANMLSVYEYDVENSNFIAKFGEEDFRKLYPDSWKGDDPIIPVGTKFETSNAKSETTAEKERRNRLRASFGSRRCRGFGKPTI